MNGGQVRKTVRYGDRSGLGSVIKLQARKFGGDSEAVWNSEDLGFGYGASYLTCPFSDHSSCPLPDKLGTNGIEFRDVPDYRSLPITWHPGTNCRVWVSNTIMQRSC